MKWEVRFPKDTMPSFDDVQEYIYNPLWGSLHTILIQEHKESPKWEYS